MGLGLGFGFGFSGMSIGLLRGELGVAPRRGGRRVGRRREDAPVEVAAQRVRVVEALRRRGLAADGLGGEAQPERVVAAEQVEQVGALAHVGDQVLVRADAHEALVHLVRVRINVS